MVGCGRVVQSSKQNVLFVVPVADRWASTRPAKQKIVCGWCSSRSDACKWHCFTSFTSMNAGERRFLTCKKLQTRRKVKQRSEVYLLEIVRKHVVVKRVRSWRFLQLVFGFCFACVAERQQERDQSHQAKSCAQMCKRM